MSEFRKRRKRRTARQRLAHGPLAIRRHRKIAGRTGTIRSKQRKGLRAR